MAESHTPPPLRGYALWLCPGGAQAEGLDDAIRSVAAREGTPAFRAHVTLLGPMDGPEQVRVAQLHALARGLQALALQATSVKARPDYYRGVVMEVGLTTALAAALKQAARLFGQPAQHDYHPHLSLVYGGMPVLRKAELCAELAYLGRLQLHAEALELVALEGPPQAWRTVARAPLGG